ncbi:hypothetical protein HNY73_013114 [Argiope bruennichi]|uniref:Uncharacterized protein n=1 Tax=Argiope bruennichi TaxID=94029 RepID=A0A8T0EXQ2_ARGBR|nr:hypothetical protein HNY73_013114 [Argiope bruennichi]
MEYTSSILILLLWLIGVVVAISALTCFPKYCVGVDCNSDTCRSDQLYNEEEHLCRCCSFCPDCSFN